VKLVASLEVDEGKVSFSILERIDVGETLWPRLSKRKCQGLSVSSNGSTWVKLRVEDGVASNVVVFQYPRTDRRG